MTAVATVGRKGYNPEVGHATNLFESTDLMGYGWNNLDNPLQPVLSLCDVEAVAYVVQWFFDEDPHPPGPGPYVCDSGV